MSNTRIIDLRSPDFLQICLTPRRRPVHHHHHHHLSQREERKSSFTKGGWIKKDKCKVTLPKFKVGVIQQPVSGIVDKIKGAWSKVKLMVASPHLVSVASATKRSSVRKRSSTASGNRGSGDANLSSPFSPSSSSSYYSQQAVADCIEFIKQSSSSSSLSSSAAPTVDT